jgi:hypothetical protein
MPGSAASVTGAKRIARDRDEFILPDGTQVPADEKGGFRLPNGEYVAALLDGLCCRTVCDVPRTMKEDISAPDGVQRVAVI